MRLGSDEIHIWQINTTRDLDPVPPLSESEQHRSSRFHSPHDRQRYRTTRAALRRILAHYLRIPADRVPIREGSAGKPCLLDSAPLEFNVSHSGELALVAVSHRPVGIDLEVMDPSLDWALLAEAHCHPREQVYIAGDGSAGALARFYRIWTRKEAYLKAIGIGLMRAPESFCALPDRIDEWHLHDWPEPPPGYTAALATPLPRPAWTVREFALHAGAVRIASAAGRHEPISKLNQGERHGCIADLRGFHTADTDPS